MEMMINYALTGKMQGYNLSLDNYAINKSCVALYVVSTRGRVGAIYGLEKIKRIKGLVAVDQTYQVGDYIEKSGTLGQIVLRILLIADNVQELKISIKEIQETVRVLDDKGNDMLLPPFDIERINI